MVSLSNITLQISLPLQKIQCEVLRVLKSFLISWPIHNLRLWSLSCATSTFASLSISLLKNHVDGKFVQDKENFANRAQMWVVTLNGPGSKYMQKKKQHENLAGCYQLVLPCFSPTFPMEFIDLKIQKTVITWKPSLGFFCFDCSILLSKQKQVKWVGVFFCFSSDCFKVQSVKSCWH